MCEDLVTEAEMCPVHAVPTLELGGFERPRAPVVEGTVIQGRYRAERLLDVGGMGAVLIAVQLGMNRPVALKLLRGTQAVDLYLVRRFYREAQAISSLSHPNIVQVFDFGFDPELGAPFLAMELVDGQTLEELLRAGRLPERRACSIAAQVARALFEAHARGVVHRDLKPGNIMVSRLRDGEEHVKVLDFGVAKILHAKVEGLTAPGSTVGSPHYMSPEQAKAEEVDHRADLYSLGCVLFEALAGHVPFDADRTLDVMRKQVFELAPRLPGRLADGRAPSAAVSHLVEALLEKDPAHRPPNAGLVARLLGAIARGEEVDVAGSIAEERGSGHVFTPRDPSAGTSTGTSSALDEGARTLASADPGTDPDAVSATWVRTVAARPGSVAPGARGPEGSGGAALPRTPSARVRIQNSSTLIPPEDEPARPPAGVVVSTVERPPPVRRASSLAYPEERRDPPAAELPGDTRALPAPPPPDRRVWWIASAAGVSLVVAAAAIAVLRLDASRAVVTAPLPIEGPPPSVARGPSIAQPVEVRATPPSAVARPPSGEEDAAAGLGGEPAPRASPSAVRARDGEAAPGNPRRGGPRDTGATATRARAEGAPPERRPRGPEGEGAAPEVRAGADPPPKHVRSILLSSDPAGAEILRDGVVIGQTPLAVERPPEGSTIRVTLRKTGFVDRRIDLTQRTGAELVVKLMAEW